MGGHARNRGGLPQVLEKLLESARCDNANPPANLRRYEDRMVSVRRDPQCAARRGLMHRLVDENFPLALGDVEQLALVRVLVHWGLPAVRNVDLQKR